MPAVPQSKVEKYIKVRALADRGVSGERDQAARTLYKLEQDFPGIRQEAARQVAAKTAKAANKTAPPPGAAPHTGSGPFGTPGEGWPPGARNGNWENIFRYAKDVYQGFQEFAETVADTQTGRELSFYVECGAKLSQANNVIINMKMPLSIYQQVTQLNGLQKEAFRRALHDLLDEQLDTLLGDE